MNKFMLLIIGITNILITACSNPISDLDDINTLLNSHELTSFSVVGTSADTPEGLTPIDPQTNGGTIHVRWTVRDLLQNSIKLVLSNDNSLSNDDVEIYFSLCNLAAPCGQAQIDIPCVFNTSNEIECGLVGRPTVLTSLLDTIPKDAFIIIESCLNGFPLSCDTRSDGVKFQ